MRRLWIVAIAACVFGCRSGTEVDTGLVATSTDVVGAFNLLAANGQAPPFTAFVTQTEQWTLVADTLSIAADNSWNERTSYVVLALSDGSTTSRASSVSGTYSIANGQINFVETAGGTDAFPGSVTGNVLTLVFNGKRFLYSR